MVAGDGSRGGEHRTMRRRYGRIPLCAFMALPTMIRAPAPPLSSFPEAEDDAPKYLRRAASMRPPLHLATADDGRDHSRGDDDSFVSSAEALLRGFAVSHANRINDAGEIGVGDGQGVESAAPSRIDGYNSEEWRVDGMLEDDSLVRRRRLQQTAQWYVDWMESKCVQSCLPTRSNRHCAGWARWDQHLFESAVQCCRATLGWMPVGDCASVPNGSGAIAYLSAKESNADSGDHSVTKGIKCPDEYAHLSDYKPFDMVTVYISKKKGDVYQCKNSALARYCNVFRPDWNVGTAPGAVHTVGEDLGWKYLGKCDGTQLVLGGKPSRPGQEDLDGQTDDEDEGRPLSGVSPADIGFGSSSGPVGASSPTTSKPSGGSRPAAASKPGGAAGSNDLGGAGKPGRPSSPTQGNSNGVAESLGLSTPGISPSNNHLSGEALKIPPASRPASAGKPASVSKPSNGKPNRPRPKKPRPNRPRPIPVSKPASSPSPPGMQGDFSPASGGGDGKPKPGTGSTGTWLVSSPVSDPSSTSGLGSFELTGPTGSLSFGSGPDPSSLDGGGASPSSSSSHGSGGTGDGGEPSTVAGSDMNPSKIDQGMLVSDPSSSQIRPDPEDNDLPERPSVDFGSGAIPRPDMPDNPIRPYEPAPGIQVQMGPPRPDEDEDDQDSLREDEKGMRCWRSGTVCQSDADHFACCTACINGVCV